MSSKRPVTLRLGRRRVSGDAGVRAFVDAVVDDQLIESCTQTISQVGSLPRGAIGVACASRYRHAQSRLVNARDDALLAMPPPLRRAGA